MKKVVSLSLFLVVCVNITLAQLPSYVPTNGLIGFWPFNGNANDVSGNANNGVVNGATLTTDRFGAPNNCFDFNGLSSFIEVGSNTSLHLNGDFTLSAWFICDSIYDVPGTVKMLVAKQQNGINNNGYAFGVWNNAYSNIRRGVVNFSAAPVFTAQTFPRDSVGDVFVNNWYCCTITYSLQSGSLRYFLNGSLIDTVQVNFLTSSNTKNLLFGCNWEISGTGKRNFFNGKIDDIGIWGRALTNQEIVSLYLGCPKILTQPTNQTATKGANGNFNVIHSGTNYTYQWQTNPIGCGWQNLPNSNQYSGVSTSALNINNLTVSNHNQPLRVIASKGSCIDTSNVVRMIISNIASDSLALISLKSDTTTKGNRIRQLEIDLANNRDTLYVGSNITTDTLIISIRTGLSMSSSLLNTLRVYPNPAATVINVELQKPGTYIAKISGITGQTIVTQTAGTIDISTLASGVYVLSIFDTNNKLVSTNKISVVR